MHFYSCFILLLPVLFNLMFYYTRIDLIQLCEIETCPFCYGNNLCEEFKNNKIMLNFNSINDLIYNLFSVKNVYYARYGEINLVLKKLGHNSELREIYEQTENKKYSAGSNLSEILLNSENKPFRLCNNETVNLFLQNVSHKNIINLWTLLKINVEPLLLEIFSKDENWPVPRLYGYCGRIVAIENCGVDLNQVENYSWYDRAYIAYQLLISAHKFTSDHQDFRLYLTDISSDNVVIDKQLKISFVDLEHAVLIKKTTPVKTHYTEHFDGDSYIFSEKQLCKNDISDHNIYAVCRLLLSKNAPWPMMKNGLLHSPSKYVFEKYEHLIEDIELCVNTKENKSRFNVSYSILNKLKTILLVQKDYKYKFET